MDVGKHVFYPLLLDILEDITSAHFVALDLELSGVPSKQLAQTQRGESGRPSLQERYLETKEAAEKYQILQIGLTCVEQDVVSEKYVLKPYNFDLNPLIEQRNLDVERIFSYQSGAVEFLLKNGFDMSKPFHRGVPYLSRMETKEARGKHVQRQDRASIADIQVAPTDVESLAFLDRVRQKIHSWMDDPEAKEAAYCLDIIAPPIFETQTGDFVSQDLTRFEKRLVHQLVRAEFPTLVTISKRGSVQIIHYDKEREDRWLVGRKKDSEERIARQKGFYWIIKALRGGKLGGLDLRECVKDPQTGDVAFHSIDSARSRFTRIQNLLGKGPKMLVGHNCFLDVIYLYRTFIGALPDTVEEFQREIHHCWPHIVDTKYMSTHECGDINPISSLEQIAQQLCAQDHPQLEIHPKHGKYHDVEALHEAGFDSYLTAQIAVRLSAKLERAGAYVNVDTKPGTVNDLTNKLHQVKLNPNITTTTSPRSASRVTTGPSPLSPPFIPSNSSHQWERTGDPSLTPPDETQLSHYLGHTNNSQHESNEGSAFHGGMPRLSSDFWRVYGNKLRVFGTAEGVCVLRDEGTDSAVESENEALNADGGVEL